MSENYDIPEYADMLKGIDQKKALTFIMGFSAVAVIALFWLIYFKPPMMTEIEWIKDLGALNASLNLLSTIFLLYGFNEIKKRNFKKHMRYMMGAFVSSALFLVSYMVYHTFVGDTKFTGEGTIRFIYFFILISHIVLSVAVVPMILTTFYFSLSGKFEKHRMLARWTFPIWLYVSITGVLVYLFLKNFG